MVSLPRILFLRNEKFYQLFLFLARIASKIIQGYLCTPVESLCEVSITDVVSVMCGGCGYRADGHVVLCSRERDVYWDVYLVSVWVSEKANVVSPATNRTKRSNYFAPLIAGVSGSFLKDIPSCLTFAKVHL